MGLPTRHDDHLVRPLVHPDRRPPGGKTVIIDPWFGNPTARSAPTRSSAATCCSSPTATSTTWATRVALASRLRPAWPCIHEMSLWLARRLPGGADQVIGMNKGGTVEAAGLRVTMVHADHSAGDWNPAGETTLYLGDPSASSSSSRTATASTSPATREVVRRHAPHPRAVSARPRDAADRRPLHDGPDAARRWPSSCWASRTSCRIHYGTFPVLAGTPDQLRDALAARGLGSVRVHEPKPGISGSTDITVAITCTSL